LDISALRTLCYSLNNNGILERLSFRFLLLGWVGFKKMDPRPTLSCSIWETARDRGTVVDHSKIYQTLRVVSDNREKRINAICSALNPVNPMSRNAQHIVTSSSAYQRIA